MKTTTKMVRVEGYNPQRVATAKAVRVTVDTIDGETARADTTWLPRSLAADLRIEAEYETHADGYRELVGYRFTALVPEWWTRKLDTRAGWQKAGYAYAPHATRPC